MMAVAMSHHAERLLAQRGPFGARPPSKSQLTNRPGSPDAYACITLVPDPAGHKTSLAHRLENQVADAFAVATLWPFARRPPSALKNSSAASSRFGFKLIPVEGGSLEAVGVSSPRRVRRLEGLLGSAATSPVRACTIGADSPRSGPLLRLAVGSTPAKTVPAAVVEDEVKDEKEVVVEVNGAANIPAMAAEEEVRTLTEAEVEEHHPHMLQRPSAGPRVPLCARYHTSAPPPMPSALLLAAACLCRRTEPAAAAGRQVEQASVKREQEVLVVELAASDLEEREEQELQVTEEVEVAEPQPRQRVCQGPCVPLYARFHTCAPPPQPTALLALLQARRSEQFKQSLQQWGLMAVTAA
ncbi:hypothetical protein HYH02_009113 [Chlamydomonas schloesseri]|uniref:Uncharacterized protein n=1 Tax=Chlamydomonas schloesseri TaxID=2026947 RepID=A0A836B123_9CHLO|nr:hypothetical protein HYH02_009113 [Chlamydomonas schloesseri]|eukprot:KAG2444174.1 hypothetical protein HYH02_009113 [Chlamydomonas schloesseri]